MIAFFTYPSKIIHWGSEGSWKSSLAQSPQRFPAQPWPSISSRPARSSPGNCILWNQIQKATCYSFAPKYGAPQETTICICPCPRNTRKWHSALKGKEKISWGVYHKLIGLCFLTKEQDPFQSGHTTKCKEILAPTYMLILLCISTI